MLLFQVNENVLKSLCFSMLSIGMVVNYWAEYSRCLRGNTSSSAVRFDSFTAHLFCILRLSRGATVCYFQTKWINCSPTLRGHEPRSKLFNCVHCLLVAIPSAACLQTLIACSADGLITEILRFTRDSLDVQLMKRLPWNTTRNRGHWVVSTNICEDIGR